MLTADNAEEIAIKKQKAAEAKARPESQSRCKKKAEAAKQARCERKT